MRSTQTSPQSGAIASTSREGPRACRAQREDDHSNPQDVGHFGLTLLRRFSREKSVPETPRTGSQDMYAFPADPALAKSQRRTFPPSAAETSKTIHGFSHDPHSAGLISMVLRWPASGFLASSSPASRFPADAHQSSRWGRHRPHLSHHRTCGSASGGSRRREREIALKKALVAFFSPGTYWEWRV